jgi:hypothetical protein
MKKIFVIICLVTWSKSGFGQTVESTQSISDSTKTEIVNQLGYDPVKVGDSTAEMASGWTQEEKDWFKSTFIHKSGQFKVPEQPIVDPYANR